MRGRRRFARVKLVFCVLHEWLKTASIRPSKGSDQLLSSCFAASHALLDEAACPDSQELVGNPDADANRECDRLLCKE